MTLLPEIGAQFHVLKNAQEGAADAEITSAFPLSDAQVKELVATLEKKFGRKLNPSVTVDSITFCIAATALEYPNRGSIALHENHV